MSHTVTFNEYTVKHVALAQFISLTIISGSRNNRWNRVVALPSRAFKRKDGTLTVQSRKTDTGFKGYPLASYDRIFGMLPTGESVEVTFQN